MSTRYIVRDVEESLAFYVGLLGFREVEKWGSAFAIVELDGATLWLSGPESSAAKAMPDGRKPEPGGWNRIVVGSEDLEGLISTLRGAGVVFRNEPLSGPGGTQVLIEDPSGNPIELFQAR
ncbi:VOC family protein [Fimbriimonas ginsengisoli]|nr:VOC family protein [Fimbriimonas ginsengisoli]